MSAPRTSWSLTTPFDAANFLMSPLRWLIRAAARAFGLILVYCVQSCTVSLYAAKEVSPAHGGIFPLNIAQYTELVGVGVSRSLCRETPVGRSTWKRQHTPRRPQHRGE